jgi:hypothetical protein
MDKLYIVVDSCEICSSEYIKAEMDKIKDLLDPEKTKEAHRIIHAAYKAKPCVRYPCREQLYDNVAYHNICVEHLYKMIDAIKEFEDESND